MTVRTVVVAALTAVSAGSVGAQAPQDAGDLLRRVGARVEHFYARAKHLVCIETSTVHPIDAGFSSQGFARTVESELRVEFADAESGGEASVVRKIRRVNGRAPRADDDKAREGCTDPNPLSSEPLSFLLPEGRLQYAFKTAGTTTHRGRATRMVDFTSVNRRSRAELIYAPSGHDDCFDWTGYIASAGRLWIDAETDDVVRLDRRQIGPVDVRVPALIQRRYRLDNWVTIVRDDTTIRYKTMAFADPDEVLLVPESIDAVTLIRSGLQSTRRTHRFSDYKRFVTGGRVLHP